MANLVKDVTSFEQKIFKISGPLGKLMPLTKKAAIKAGQILFYDEATGKLEALATGKEAFTIALEEVDAQATKILVAVPGTVFNSEELLEVAGAKFKATKTEHYKIIKQLWSNGILLEEVK